MANDILEELENLEIRDNKDGTAILNGVVYDTKMLAKLVYELSDKIHDLSYILHKHGNTY